MPSAKRLYQKKMICLSNGDSMSIENIPFGWNLKKMPEVVKWSSGGTPKATVKEYYENGNIPWLIIGDLNDGIVNTSATRITELGLNNSSAKLVPAGTLLVAMYGSIGKLGITGIECCTNQAIAFAKEMYGVTTEYMFYYLLLMKSKLISLGKGGTQKNISLTVLNSIDVVVPPITEQQRIVERIEEMFSQLDSAVETLKKTKQQLAVYRQAVLKKAFEGTFTKHNYFDVDLKWSSEEENKKLPDIPKEWKYVYLSELGDLGRGKSKHRPRNDPKLFENGKYPFLQTSEVKSARYTITQYSKMYGDFGLRQSKLWPKGTLCITIAANIAETAFLGIDACFPDSVVGFTPYQYVIPEYIKHFLESQKLRLWAFAPATAQKNINLDTLENLIVPYCSLQEQKEIVVEIESRMSICDNIEKTVDTALQQAEAMCQSILKKAFEGKL